MVDKRKRKIKIAIGGVALCVVLLMLVGVVFALKYLLKDDQQRRKRRIQMISVVKPPPPPKIKEKPPEPEIKKKEELIEPEPEETPPEPTDDMSEDDVPPGEDLGLDADGTAGSDGFGLRAKKGGRALIGGAYSDASMMRRYGWYTRIIQEELRKQLNSHMESNGGYPEGNPKALVLITLDELGKIVEYNLSRSSGNEKMDDALVSALRLATISEPPPKGMPRIIKLKISAKG
jgi:TonB family protein